MEKYKIIHEMEMIMRVEVFLNKIRFNGSASDKAHSMKELTRLKERFSALGDFDEADKEFISTVDYFMELYGQHEGEV